jgi:hypothetical protein
MLPPESVLKVKILPVGREIPLTILPEAVLKERILPVGRRNPRELKTNVVGVMLAFTKLGARACATVKSPKILQGEGGVGHEKPPPSVVN